MAFEEIANMTGSEIRGPDGLNLQKRWGVGQGNGTTSAFGGRHSNQLDQSQPHGLRARAADAAVGFLTTEKDGRKAYHRVAEPHLANIMACVEARFGGKG